MIANSSPKNQVGLPNRLQKGASDMEDVSLETSMGTIVCEMYYDHAPRTCKNFVELVCPIPELQGANDSRLGEDITME